MQLRAGTAVNSSGCKAHIPAAKQLPAREEEEASHAEGQRVIAREDEAQEVLVHQHTHYTQGHSPHKEVGHQSVKNLPQCMDKLILCGGGGSLLRRGWGQ